MRKSALTGMLALLVLLIASAASASLEYLDNNADYPVSYYHANYREYVDLTSCTFREDSAYLYYATGYISFVIGPENDIRAYHTRQFRKAKDGISAPQFYDESAKEWVTMPAYDYGEISRYITEHGYSAYISDYYPYEYYMFKIVYEKINEVPYPDNLEGKTP